MNIMPSPAGKAFFTIRGDRMNNNEREEMLIHQLLKESSYVTVKTIAEQLHLSSKTIYRLIAKINDGATAELIEAAKGKGIRLNYTAYLESRYNHQQQEETFRPQYDFSPVERRLHIIKELLFHAPLGLRENDLFSPYYLSQSAIYNDEELISKMLQGYGLALSKNNNRLTVTGPESRIRQALIQLLTKLNLINIDDLAASGQEFNQQDLRFAKQQLERIEQEIDSIIPAPYNINLLTNLYILICRGRRGDFDQNAAPSELPGNGYYPLARKIAANIASYICRPLPETETCNIACFLSGSRIHESPQPIVNQPASELTQFYIQEFSAREQLTIQSPELFRDLANHIAPLLHRLQHGLIVTNPLLDEIRQEYGHIFHVIQSISQLTCEKFALAPISDDENGFITLYFARYLEQNPQNIRLLIICTTGLGTSELLRAKVKRFFPDLDIVGTASVKSVTPAFLSETRIDIILTTVKLPITYPVPTLLVSSLFIERDKENLRQLLRERQPAMHANHNTIPINTICCHSKGELFLALLRNAPHNLQEHSRAIAAALLEREHMGDTCIAPGIALAHAQIPEIATPYAAAALLEKPMEWDKDGNAVSIVIMILIPMIPAAATIHKLHKLMHKLADEELTAQLLAHPTAAEIQQLLFS